MPEDLQTQCVVSKPASAPPLPDDRTALPLKQMIERIDGYCARWEQQWRARRENQAAGTVRVQCDDAGM